MNRTSMLRALCGFFAAAALSSGCVIQLNDSGSGKDPDGSEGEQKPARDQGSFENPGGMWMPTQMAEHAETLEKLGLAYDPNALTDPTAFPLNAVVSLGFCSGSFVSPDGLIVTNHHCTAPVALPFNSTPEDNVLVNGFLAKTREEERWAGPQQRIYVTTAVKDVTSTIREGLDSIADDTARYEELVKRADAQEEKCRAENPDTRCTVASYFEGAEFYQIEQLELRDIRLVYAPHSGVGVFGGEIDNWRWPRHTGDFAFLRAYVGPDGKPADHSKDNVPYHPPHHLKMASEPLEKGDLVMVAGYPGRTNRFKTADEVRDATEYGYPNSISRLEKQVMVLQRLAATDPELAIKVSRRIRGSNNALTNHRGMLDGLSKGGLADQKDKEEAALREWIAADPERQKMYGGVLDEIAKLNAEQRKTRDHDRSLSILVGASHPLRRAIVLMEVAQNRGKAKEEQDPNLEGATIAKAIERGNGNYDERIDRAMTRLALLQMASVAEPNRPAVYKALVGDETTEAAIDAAIDKLYSKTKVMNVKRAQSLAKSATPAKLRKSKDPALKAAMAAFEPYQKVEASEKRYAGAMAALRPKYVAAVRAHSKTSLAPDANGTLRITYGTVRGYKPTPDAEMYEPFTKISEVAAKHTGEEPFNAPANVLEAIEAKKFGNYVHDDIGEVPVDFLADLDITGGNSGSAALNAKGELVGLAFDGNYEAMASDWIFMPEITRSIQVDARYMLWLMDAVDGADHLVQEMGVTPSVD